MKNLINFYFEGYFEDLIYQNGEYFILKKSARGTAICRFEPETESKFKELYNIPVINNIYLVPNQLNFDVLFFLHGQGIYLLNLRDTRLKKKIASFEFGRIKYDSIGFLNQNKLLLGFFAMSKIKLIRFNPEFGEDSEHELLDQKEIPRAKRGLEWTQNYIAKIYCFNNGNDFALVNNIEQEGPDLIDSVIIGKLVTKKSKIYS